MSRRWATGWVLVAAGAVAGVAVKAAVERAAAPAARAAAAVEPPLEFGPEEVVRVEPGSLGGRIEFSGPLVAPDTAVVRARAAVESSKAATPSEDSTPGKSTLWRPGRSNFPTNISVLNMQLSDFA